ncbi:TerD family protein [Streptomyces sp. MP131-18]|uniref:TerD family protein n=1 Tax=Streptomyces sp. MP131-18 TaxID=1857892 RepID=UPI00097CA2F8|nr:TerD family protein [Streptomyces sp. MP131-18]ONK11548.1 General stress protein 16U [Streptomyces sp. MP131-18]
MVTHFQRGRKARLSDLTLGTDLYVGVQITGPGMVFDISCFGLDADERLSDDRYFIFFNQPKSPEEALQQLGAQAGDTDSFRVTLDRVPASIDRLAFTATIDGEGTMSGITSGYLRIVAGGEEVARYSFDHSEFSTERAVMLGDFYRKDGWRFAAVGQGFDGGLDALLRHFGGEVAEEEPPPAAPAAAPGFAPPGGGPAPVPGFAPPPQAAAPPPAPAPAPAPAAPAPAPAPMPPAPAPTQPIPVPGAFAPPPGGGYAPPPGPAAAPPPPPGGFGAPPVPPPGGYAAPPGAPPAAPYGAPPQPYQQTPPQPVPGAQHVPGAPQPVPGAPLPVPGVQPVPGAAPVPGGMLAVLEQYRGATERRRWSQQNPQLMRADLGVDGQPFMALQGSMVLYQGDVDFGFKGGGLKRRATTWATGQGFPSMMRCTGSGQVYLAEEATRLHPVELQGDAICVASQHVLAFDESLEYEVRRIDGHGLPGGSLFALQFQGHGTLVVKTHGEPLVLPVTPMTFADANAVIAWSAGAQVLVANQVRLRRQAFPGHSGETTQLQFRGAPGNFAIVQPYEI